MSDAFNYTPIRDGVSIRLNVNGNLYEVFDKLPVKVRKAEEAVQSMTKTVEKAGTFMERFNATAKAMNQNQLVSNVETIGSVFIQFGGNVSRVSAIVTSLIRPLSILRELFSGVSTEILATGAGMAAGAVAGYALVKSFGALAQSAKDAKDELERMGVVGLSRDGIDNINAYDQGVRQLTQGFDELAFVLGSKVAGPMGLVLSLLGQGAQALATQFGANSSSNSGVWATGTGPDQNNFLPPRKDEGWNWSQMLRSGAAGAGVLGAPSLWLMNQLGAASDDLTAQTDRHDRSGQLLAVLDEVNKREKEHTEEIIKQVKEYEKLLKAAGRPLNEIKPPQYEKSVDGADWLLGMRPDWDQLDSVIARVNAGFDETSKSMIEFRDNLAETAAKFKAWSTDMTNKSVNQLQGALGIPDSAIHGILTTILGPVGDIVGGILDVALNLDSALNSLWNEFMVDIGNLPVMLLSLMRDTLPNILRDLPYVAFQLMVGLPAEIVAAVIAAIPELTVGMVQAFVTFAPAMWAMIKNATLAWANVIKDSWSAGIDHLVQVLKDFISKMNPFDNGPLHIGNPFKGWGVHFDSGLHFGNNKPNHGNATLPTKDRAGSSIMSRGSGNSTHYNVNMTVVASDPRKMAEQVRQQQGTYGMGLNLAPLAP